MGEPSPRAFRRLGKGAASPRLPIRGSDPASPKHDVLELRRLLLMSRCRTVAFLLMLPGPAASGMDPPQFLLEWGTRGNVEGQLITPHGISVSADGDVYVADTGNNRIQKFNSEGAFITGWGESGAGIGQFNHPHGIAVAPDGNVYVGETGNARIQKFTSDGAFIRTWGTRGSGNGQFLHLHDLATDGAGNVYATDRDTHSVQKFTSDGTFVTRWGSFGFGDGQFDRPNGIAVDEAGDVYVADTSARIQKFASDSSFLLRWGTEGPGDGQLDFPRGMSADRLGNVFVADRDNHRIQMFRTDGSFVTKWGSSGAGPGEFSFPYAVTADASGNVYVADSSNDRVQRFMFVEAACPLLDLALSGSGDDTLLSWNEPAGAESYCVEMGDLGVLRATDGDFTSSIAQELASHTTANSLLFSGAPGPGEGYWFLVKDNPAGTFDSGCPSQVGSRDQEISSAGDTCVN